MLSGLFLQEGKYLLLPGVWGHNQPGRALTEMLEVFTPAHHVNPSSKYTQRVLVLQILKEVLFPKVELKADTSGFPAVSLCAS